MAILEPDMVDPHPDRERLVNNDSVESFVSRYSEDNQITITRQINNEKYSTMSFKPLDKNMVHVTITNGEYKTDKHELPYGYVTSQDLRQQYIGKAKFGVAFVFLLIFIMCAVIVYCLFVGPTHVADLSGDGVVALASSNESMHNTMTYNDTMLINSTDSAPFVNATNQNVSSTT